MTEYTTPQTVNGQEGFPGQITDMRIYAQAWASLAAAGRTGYTAEQFFGPGNPILPTHPEEEPRIFQYAPGNNLILAPRSGYNLMDFSILRAIGNYSKEVILNKEHIKRQIRGFKWEITSKSQAKIKAMGRQWVATPNVKEIEEFWESPDGQNDFVSWLNMLLEELLITDAVTLWPSINSAGRKVIEIIDGTTIRPLMDARGRIPDPPLPAYLQVLYGIPRSAFPASLLIYKPLNTKVYQPYGESPIEWIMGIINTSMRRDLQRIGYFTEGNIPGAFAFAPPDWTPEQIRTYQEYIDAVFKGDIARSGKLLTLPGGTRAGVTQFQNHDQNDITLDNYLMQVACWAFGNSPAEFGIVPGSGLGGQGYMEGAENIQYRSLIGPVMQYLENLFTKVTQGFLERPELKMSSPDMEPIEDREKDANIHTQYIGANVYGVEYVQDQLNIPQEYRTSPPPPPDPAQLLEAAVQTPPDKFKQQVEESDIKKWKERALRAHEKGWKQIPFESEAISPEKNLLIMSKLLVAQTPDEIRKAFDPSKKIKDVAEAELNLELNDYFAGLRKRINDYAATL